MPNSAMERDASPCQAAQATVGLMIAGQRGEFRDRVGVGRLACLTSPCPSESSAETFF